jgi:hypothetical protein
MVDHKRNIVDQQRSLMFSWKRPEDGLASLFPKTRWKGL